MNREKRRVEYYRYLDSPEWKLTRHAIEARANGKCELCKHPMDAVHHVEYPKVFDGVDHPNNLIGVCADCHNKIHGIQTMETSIQLKRHEVLGPDGNSYYVGMDMDNRIWAPTRAWEKPLGVPEHKRGWFESQVELQALNCECYGGHVKANWKDQIVYRWSPVEFAISHFYSMKAHDFSGYRDNQIHDRKKLQEYKFWDSIHQIRVWGQDLQEQALSKALMGQASTEQYDDTTLQRGFAMLAEIQNRHDLRFIEHDSVIKQHQKLIEQHIEKDPNEPITACDGIIECGKDPNTIIEGRQNFEQWVGNWLKKNSYQPVGKSEKRLSGCARVTEINLWRRCDVREGIKAAI